MSSSPGMAAALEPIARTASQPIFLAFSGDVSRSAFVFTLMPASLQRRHVLSGLLAGVFDDLIRLP